MLDANVVTIGLVGIVAACVGTGVGVVIWLYNKFDSLKDELLEAISASRAGGDVKSDELGQKIDELADRQRAHELSVEQRFITKDTASATFGRLEKAMDDVRNDVRDLLRQVNQILGSSRRSTRASKTV